MMHSKQMGESVKPRRNPMAQMRGFADGGEVDPEMAKKIAENQERLNPKPKVMFGGLFSSSKPAPAPAPAPAAPTIVSNLQNRKNALEEANKSAGYSGGGKPGMKSGGKIVGPGTPTSDSIPAKVKETGENIAVSVDERILSAAQDAMLERVAAEIGFPSLDAWLETATGKPVGPTMRDGTQGAAFGADGASFDDIANQSPTAQYRVKPASNITSSAIAPPPSAPAQPAPAAVNPMSVSYNQVTGSSVPGVSRVGNSFSATPEQPKVAGMLDTASKAFDQPAPIPAAPAAAPAAAAGTIPVPSAPPAKPTIVMPEGADANAYTSEPGYTPSNNPITNMFADSAAAARGGNGTYEEIRAARNAPPAQPVAATPAAVAPTSVPTVPTAPVPAATNPAMTPKPGGGSSASMVDTQVNAGVVRQGNSFTGTGPNVKEDMRNPLTSVNLASNNESMAKTNAIRQEMIDSQAGYRAEPGSSGGRIADSGRVEGDALLDKWGRQDATKAAMDMAAANPKAAQAIASTYGSSVQGENALSRDASDTARNSANNTTLRRGQDTRLQETGMQGDVTKRGQDVHAQIAANQVAGNPLNNALTSAQTEGVTADVETKKKNQALIDEVLNPATAPERKAAIMSAIGKGDKFAHAQGGTSIDPGTGLAIKTPDVIYNERTGQSVNAAPYSAQKLPMPKGYTAESMTKEAEAAVKAGKSRAAVAAELAKYGIAFK